MHCSVPIASSVFRILLITVWLSAASATAQVEWSNTTGSPDPWFDIGSNWVGGVAPGATDDVIFSPVGSDPYEVWWDSTTATAVPTIQGLGFSFSSPDVTFTSRDSTQHQLSINGAGGGSGFSLIRSSLTLDGLHVNSTESLSLLDFSTMVVDGSHSAGSRLTVSGSRGITVGGWFTAQSGAQVSSTSSTIGGGLSRGNALVTGAGTVWSNSGDMTVGGELWDGELRIEAGGLVTSSNGHVGSRGDRGVVFVRGLGSQWNNSSGMYVGSEDDGELTVEGGGIVNSEFGRIGNVSTAEGIALIRGNGSQWINSSSLTVGGFADGTLTIEDGASVSNSFFATIGEGAGITGRVDVRDVGSTWNVNSDLTVGSLGNGVLNIEGGTVSVSGVTTLGDMGQVNMADGRFEFGEITLEDFNRSNISGGVLNGRVLHAGYTDVASLTGFQDADVIRDQVSIVNSGVLYGDGALDVALTNDQGGELNTVAGERMRFTGDFNTNLGEINNFDGQVRFDGEVLNLGFVAGRGQFIADGGWLNSGVVAISDGNADVLGDFNNTQGGSIVTSGGATTTFFDDLTNDGVEIRTSEDSRTVVFGSYTGSGAFTGLGQVYLEGDLRPGSSPAVVTFEGDLFLGASANTYIEIFGTEFGDYDQFDVAGDLGVNGTLDVELGEGFSLKDGQEFLIADVDGLSSGQFLGLNEGDLVGAFDGLGLFISYTAGDGNDIALYSISSVPEPSTVGLLALFGIAFGVRKRRRSLES